ncbi:MAG: serine/threonine protein kinase [Myxococcales bacterium]|nr:serine/threonine protein kinase [Myxococcales bacterium]
MSVLCPSCRQPVADVGVACTQLACQRKGYHGVPADLLGAKVDPRVGLLLGGKYLLVKLLGKGGMGVVMIALQQPLMREVALKVISGVQIDDMMRARFTREARAVAALDHPNIVKLIDFGVASLDEDAPYMVMELVAGAEPLRKVFRDWTTKPPTWKAFGDVFTQLLSALEAAHDRGIVHRDIKPDNAMAKPASGYEWFVKVLDFGLAKSFDHSRPADPDMASLTDAGAIVGTPQYMAPEQLARQGARTPDHRVDLYAVGVMMFEVLTGRRPYPQVDAMQLVFAKADPDSDPLADSDDLDAYGPMAAVVRKGMAYSVDQRYATAAEFRAELTDAVAALGPTQIAGAVRDAAEAGAMPTETLAAPRRATAQVPTPFTGRVGASAQVPTPFTGRVGASAQVPTPYTGRVGASAQVPTPYTGRVGASAQVPTPYTGRVGAPALQSVGQAPAPDAAPLAQHRPPLIAGIVALAVVAVAAIAWISSRQASPPPAPQAAAAATPSVPVAPARPVEEPVAAPAVTVGAAVVLPAQATPPSAAAAAPAPVVEPPPAVAKPAPARPAAKAKPAKAKPAKAKTGDSFRTF